MPGHRELHRSDANAPILYDLAERLGMSVEVVQRPVDAIVGYLGLTCAVEVKDGNKKLEPKQVAFFNTFKGAAVIWRTPQDVIRTHRELHAQARMLRESNS